MTLSDCVEKYCSRATECRPYKLSAVRNLLSGSAESSFIRLCGSELQKERPDRDVIAEAVQNSVRSYSSNKDSAIAIYKSFLDYCFAHSGIKIDVKFPPIPVSNGFERLMFIAKYLQDPEHKISELPDLLWVSDRTIEDDISRLRERPGEVNEDAIEVCGRVFTIPETERRNDRLTFASTAHPLFLTWNLSQVIVMLQGLKKMGEDPLYRTYAFRAAKDVWAQLSDYAKKRIYYVSEHILPEDEAWYRSLEESAHTMFHSEYQCSCAEGSGVVLDCFKNGKMCCIEYADAAGTVFYLDCRIVPRSYDGKHISIDCGQGQKQLIIDNILRSSYTKEGLY